MQAAKASGASPHLANPMKLAFAKQVTRQYFAELADEYFQNVVKKQVLELILTRQEPGRPIAA